MSASNVAMSAPDGVVSTFRAFGLQFLDIATIAVMRQCSKQWADLLLRWLAIRMRPGDLLRLFDALALPFAVKTVRASPPFEELSMYYPQPESPSPLVAKLLLRQMFATRHPEIIVWVTRRWIHKFNPFLKKLRPKFMFKPDEHLDDIYFAALQGIVQSASLEVVQTFYYDHQLVMHLPGINRHYLPWGEKQSFRDTCCGKCASCEVLIHHIMFTAAAKGRMGILNWVYNTISARRPVHINCKRRALQLAVGNKRRGTAEWIRERISDNRLISRHS